MIQIMGLRERTFKDGTKRLSHAFFRRGWRSVSVREIFLKNSDVVAMVPEDERYNLFYTLAHCKDGDRAREFSVLKNIAFDVDGIENFDVSMCDSVADIICDFLGYASSSAYVSCSGNGVHVIFDLQEKDWFLSTDRFKDLRAHYKAVCVDLSVKLVAAGFTGARVDEKIFDAARILRLPGTKNIKGENVTKACVVRVSDGALLPLTISEVSGLAKLGAGESVSLRAVSAYPPADTEAIRGPGGCGFIRYAEENQQSISEPEWYAYISVMSRISKEHTKCVELIHEGSRLHPGYSAQDTDNKIEHALQFGPRTCKGVHDVWEGSKCRECPHFGKVVTPLLIRGENFIETEFTGFHKIIITEDGRRKVGPPQYEDMRKFFYRERPYFTVVDSMDVFRWHDTHWEEIRQGEVEAFAQRHFKPVAKTTLTKEFSNLVTRTRQRRHAWFQDSTYKKMNFMNGVLDLQDMSFTEHSKKFGFRTVLPYAYDPEALAPRFLKFMDDIMQGHEELIELLLEFAGYSLSGDRPWYEASVTLLGHGANGKTTFVEVLKRLAGKGNFGAMSLAALENPANRLDLDTALFNISEETPHRSLADSSLFKALVSGAMIDVKKLYSQPYMIEPRAKIWLLCNEMPKTYDMSYGMFRRMRIVPFNATFTEDKRDPHILAKLSEELPGILNIVLAAYKRMTDRGSLRKSAMVEAANEEYREESDQAICWWEDHIYMGADAVNDFTPTQKIYNEFRHAQEQAGYKNIMTLDRFTKRILQKYPELKGRTVRRQVDGARTRGIEGIRFGTSELESF